MKNFPIYTGLGIVISTHIMMLNMAMPEEWRKAHAAVNLGAAGLIIYGVYY